MEVAFKHNTISINDVDEICIIDDSLIPRALSEKVCKIALPQIPVRSFESVDSAIHYLEQAAPRKRTIFLDLEMPDKNGWDFLNLYRLHWYESLYILSSSECANDIEMSKKFPVVIDYLIKPLKPEIIKHL